MMMCAEHTVIVIRDAEDSIYGGYADIAWESSGASLASSVAFLFCLVSSKNADVQPFKMALNGTNNGSAIRCNAGGGPAFGGPGAWNMGVESDGRVFNVIGSTYAPGAPGSTLSRTSPVACTVMEVWQLADA